jgi:hypothetical protein
MNNPSRLITDIYLNNAEQMRRPDYKARKHGKPMPVRYKRVKVGVDTEPVQS